MNRILICALICLLNTIFCYAQLTPTQKELFEKYNKQKSIQNAEIEKYSSPEIYEIDNDSTENFDREKNYDKEKLSDYERKTRQRYDFLADYQDSIELEEPELELFGHDIFDDVDLSNISNPYDLPSDGYILGPGDNIIVNVWGRTDLEYNLTIDREGRIFIPKVGELTASGCTLARLTQRLTKSLNEVYSDSKLSISYGKLRQITVYIFGEVNRPGGYTVSSLSNLLHALYTAGGITENGSLRSIKLIRNTKIAGHYDLYDLLLKGDNSQNLKLLSGDVVYIPVVGPLAAISGEVKRPAIYELSGDELLVEAIELAGGIKPEAYLESISLDRIGLNDSRILKDLNLADKNNLETNNIKLQDGDKITVYSIYDFHENRVFLSGHVKHPGSFGIDDTMRISNLITNGEQLKENTYLDRADLFRTKSDGSHSIISINLGNIINNIKNSDIMLQPLDSLVVYSFPDVSRAKYVSIGGEIKKPDKYKLYNQMRLSDLVFMAGNLTKQAYWVQCELARVNPGKEADIILIDLEDVLTNKNPQADILLKEDDHVFIRQIPNWRPIEIVTIEGEVLFPGKYAIKHKGERLSDLIARAGGIIPTAFANGALYYRKTIEKDISRRNIGQVINNTQETYYDSTGNVRTETQIKFNPSQLNRIIIDLPKILENHNSPLNIVLADSDYVFIPKYPSGVQVIGAVAANGTISYIKNQKTRYYIEQAGGYTPDGDKSELRLVKPNGMVFYGHKARNIKIQLGDAIVIPSKIKRKTDWGKILTTSATILGTMATTALVIDRLN